MAQPYLPNIRDASTCRPSSGRISRIHGQSLGADDGCLGGCLILVLVDTGDNPIQRGGGGLYCIRDSSLPHPFPASARGIREISAFAPSGSSRILSQSMLWCDVWNLGS